MLPTPLQYVAEMLPQEGLPASVPPAGSGGEGEAAAPEQLCASQSRLLATRAALSSLSSSSFFSAKSLLGPEDAEAVDDPSAESEPEEWRQLWRSGTRGEAPSSGAAPPGLRPLSQRERDGSGGGGGGGMGGGGGAGGSSKQRKQGSLLCCFGGRALLEA